MEVLGVDACRTGWVGVVLRDGAFAAAHESAGLGAVLGRVPEAAVVAVDMPLGLLDGRWRQADRLAATRLGAYRARVFRVPPRQVWQEPDYASANRRCRSLTGSGLSRQAWGLAARLREANGLREGGEHRLYEVHPELSFAAMAGGRPVAWTKKSWNGQAERRRLLEDHGIALPQFLSAGDRVPPDDLLDAAAAAWSAHRIALGTAAPLPDPPERSAVGLPVAIWC